MKASVSRSSPTEAPARARFWPAEAAEPWSGLQVEKLELISRGDLVSGLRVRKGSKTATAGATRPGLLVLVHDAAREARSADWAPVATWLARSNALVVVALDLPLHGPRSSAKLSERLVSAFAALARGAFVDRNGAVLIEEFLRQSAHDLARTLDALLAPGELDPDRVGLVGLGLGARVADAFLAEDDRVRAAVLVRTRRAPALPSAGSPHFLEVDGQDELRDWSGDAERFLRSRIGL